jgi:hypothetical protein
MGTQLAAPSILTVNRGLSLEQRIAHRRELLADRRSYTIMGRLHKIVFDPFGMNLPPLTYPVVCQNMLQWLDEPYPTLALSKDEHDLLILGKIPQPSDLPGDVNNLDDYVPTSLPGWASRGGKMPRRYPQRYSDRTRGYLGGSEANPDFLVIQPIEQILFQPVRTATYSMIRPTEGPDGTRMAFLIDPRRGEGHFIGGSVLVDARIHGPAA